MLRSYRQNNTILNPPENTCCNRTVVDKERFVYLYAEHRIYENRTNRYGEKYRAEKPLVPIEIIRVDVTTDVSVLTGAPRCRAESQPYCSPIPDRHSNRLTHAYFSMVGLKSETMMQNTH